MRKKPPADRPNINSGQPWSEMDILDLCDLEDLRLQQRFDPT
jgi:hypothetical protein